MPTLRQAYQLILFCRHSDTNFRHKKQLIELNVALLWAFFKCDVLLAMYLPTAGISSLKHQLVVVA